MPGSTWRVWALRVHVHDLDVGQLRARSTSALSSTDGVAAAPCMKICWPDLIPETAS